MHRALFEIHEFDFLRLTLIFENKHFLKESPNKTQIEHARRQILACYTWSKTNKQTREREKPTKDTCKWFSNHQRRRVKLLLKVEWVGQLSDMSWKFISFKSRKISILHTYSMNLCISSSWFVCCCCCCCCCKRSSLKPTFRSVSNLTHYTYIWDTLHSSWPL